MPNQTEVKRLIRRGMETWGVGPTGAAIDEWRVSLYDPFELLPIATQAAGSSYNWDLDGAGTEAVAFASTGGGLTFTTGGTSDNSASIFALTGSQWGVARKPDLTRQHWLSAQIATGASIASTAILWGFKLTDTNATASPYKTDADQLMIAYDTAGIDIDPASGQADIAASHPNFYIVYSIAGSDYAVDSGVKVVVSTEYKWEIRITTDGKGQVYCNGTLLHTTPVLTATASLIPFYCVYTRTAGAKSHSIRWMKYLGK